MNKLKINSKSYEIIKGVNTVKGGFNPIIAIAKK